MAPWNGPKSDMRFLRYACGHTCKQRQTDRQTCYMCSTITLNHSNKLKWMNSSDTITAKTAQQKKYTKFTSKTTFPGGGPRQKQTQVNLSIFWYCAKYWHHSCSKRSNGQIIGTHFCHVKSFFNVTVKNVIQIFKKTLICNLSSFCRK